MKLVKKLLTATLVLSSILLFSCKGKSAKDMIVNKWSLTDISGEGTKGMSDEDKKTMVGKVAMELSKDGKVSITGMGDDAKTGTYTLSEDGKTLNLKRDGAEKEDAHDVNELTESKLVITEKKGDGMKLSFTAGKK